MKKIAVFPGSFDPITIGHYDLVERAYELFDQIIIAIGINTTKTYLFSIEKRKQWIEEAFKKHDKISVEIYEGLTIDYCKKMGAKYILRGLRNPSDFEFEKAIAHTNRALSNGEIETIFLLNSSGKSFISSSIVRDVIRNGGDYTKFVPSSVRI